MGSALGNALPSMGVDNRKKTIGQRLVKITEAECFKNGGVCQHPGSDPRAYTQPWEDGTPTIQAGGVVRKSADVAAAAVNYL